MANETINVSTLKINKLTREQYIKASKGELSGKTIDEENEIYLVPPSDGKFASRVSTTTYEADEGKTINNTPQFRNTIIVSSDEEAAKALDTLAIGDMVFVKEEV